MNYYCNPLNIEYRYQFVRDIQTGNQDTPAKVFREAADPSLILFKGTYYLFTSVTAGFFTSTHLSGWEYHEFSKEMPIYDYAPDVRVIGEYMYFSASKRDDNCSFYRTKDPLSEPFEEIEGTFPFWDPNLFQDDDGKIYFYWGCSNTEPIYGVELDAETMTSKTVPLVMIEAQDKTRGYERCGENHVALRTDEEIESQVQLLLEEERKAQQELPNEERMSDETLLKMLRGYLSNDPYIEGAWMTKHQDKYYLQYAITGTEYNVYADGVYVSDHPLGPFLPAKNNPYSYSPGGFITAAGHGSTMEDKTGQFWHAATMRISRNHIFERRVGLWKAGFDKDGELYCDQRYADWPIRLDAPAFEKPEWMLLSYGKNVTISSGKGAHNITDEDIRTWWKADSYVPGEWAEVDLSATYDVRAIQINFAEEGVLQPIPQEAITYKFLEERYIDSKKQSTRWLLEGSADGKRYFVIEDKWNADSDLPHDFILREEGIRVRFVRLTVGGLPYGQNPCVSGIRVFGYGNGTAPDQVKQVTVCCTGDMDMEVSWIESDAVGYNILWGYAPDKLYHSYRVFGKCSQQIGALVKGEPVYVRIDAFGESGIIEGEVKAVRER